MQTRMTLLFMLIAASSYGQLTVATPDATAAINASAAQAQMQLQKMELNFSKNQMQQLAKSGKNLTWLGKIFDNQEKLREIYKQGAAMLKTSYLVVKLADNIDRARQIAVKIKLSQELSSYQETALKVFWMDGITEKVLSLTDDAQAIARQAVSTDNQMTVGDRLLLANQALEKTNEALLWANYLVRAQSYWSNDYKRNNKDNQISELLHTQWRYRKRETIKESWFMTH